MPLKYLHGERNRKKIIVSNTNSEKYLLKQAYGYILDWTIKAAIEKILMKTETVRKTNEKISVAKAKTRR